MIRKIGSLVCITALGVASAFAAEEYRYLPDGYTQVEYIETDVDHQCVIKTDVIASDTLRATLDYVPTEYTGDVNFGDSESDNNDWRFFTYSGGPLFDCGSARAGSTSGNAIPLNERYTVEVGKNEAGKIFLDVTKHGETDKLKSFTANSGGTPYANNICIFGGMANGSATYAKMKLYSLVISDGDTTVADFVPCYSESAARYGLYDIVHEKFFAAEGGADFLYGEEVVDPETPGTDPAQGSMAILPGLAKGLSMPYVVLDSFGSGPRTATVVFEWSKSGDFTDALASVPVSVVGNTSLKTPITPEELPEELEPCAVYTVRARVTSGIGVTTEIGPISWTSPGDPDVSGYLMRANFTVAYDADEEAMDDFRVLVRLAKGQPTGFTYEQCAADGSDLVFTSADGSMAYFFDVDTWNPQGESCIWVRLPQAKKGDAFSMYYGKSGAESAADAEGTWNGYKGVWHMNETIVAETAATTKSKNATGETAMDAEPKYGSSGSDATLKEMISADGRIGLARSNGSGGSKKNYLSVPSYTGVGGVFTVSGWFKATGASGNQRIISRKNVYNSADGFECEMPGQAARITVRGASSAGPNIDVDNMTTEWRHLVLVYSNTTVTAYMNGVLKGSGTIAAVNDNGMPLSFGNNSNGSEQSFNGLYDEIRLQSVALGAKRVKAEYATMADAAFLSCTGIASTDPDMPSLESAEVAWKDDATTVSLVLKAGVGDASVVFTDVLSGQVYTIELEKGLDAREGVQAVSYPLTAEQLPLGATYSWVVTVTNGKFDRPTKIVGESKYYSGDADPTVRYVSTTGSDENDGMFLSSSKATLTAAIDALGDEGGTVYIDDGDYAFTSDTDTAVVITTPVHVVGLSRDPSKVTITCTGNKTKRIVTLAHEGASLEFLTLTGGKSSYGANLNMTAGLVADCRFTKGYYTNWDGHGAAQVQGGRMTRCVFTENVGERYGSALNLDGAAIVENCLFYGNDNRAASAGYSGGTVLLSGNGGVLINCTIAGNRGVLYSGVALGGWSNSRMMNCAIFGNTTESDTTGHGHVWSSENGTGRASNCAADGEINEACFVLKPGFRDAANNDYSLSSASELIDIGVTYADTGATSETDLAGNAREVDVVDIGCYEYTKSDLDVGFSVDKSEGLAPLEVTFTASVFGATGDVTYDWDYDNDGKTDETTDTPSVSHVYAEGGLMSVTLTATSGGKSVSATLLNAVKVSPKTVYVDAANEASAEYPYDKPETATPDLEAAIEAAGNGSTVLVADGTYSANSTAGFVVDKSLRILSVSGNPEACVLSESQNTGVRRVMTVNNGDALLAGLTIQGGYGTPLDGTALYFRSLGGTVSNCVVRMGETGGWNGDGPVGYVSANGRITHSIIEQGLCHGDHQVDQRTACLTVWGQVDNCLIRDFNRGNDNQNIVMVYAGGKLLNCTVVDGLCNTTSRADSDGVTRSTDCVGVRADTGARVENCVIVGVRHQESDETFSVRAWNGDPDAFANCATDTAEPINDTCVTVTTAAFKDYAAKDYRPTSGSPLIGKGRKNELADGTDLIGNRRASGAMDIGCYEAKSGFTVYVR